jgi:hypothetical protein
MPSIILVRGKQCILGSIERGMVGVEVQLHMWYTQPDS